MRFSRPLTVIAVIVATAGSASTSSDVLSRLGMTESDAKQTAIESIATGYVPVSMVRDAFQAAPAETRAILVKQALAWAKAYTESVDFKTGWSRMREQRKPVPPKVQGSVDDELAAQRAERLKELDDLKKQTASAPSEQRKFLLEAVAGMERVMKEMDQPLQRDLQRQAIESERADKLERYQERLKKWESDYPADPQRFLVQRIREFLTVSQDVDFSAKVVPRNGRLVFTDPRYEAKSGDWKLCYRAGKPAVDAASVFAKEWLAQLERK